MTPQQQKPEDARRAAFDILARRIGRFLAIFFGLWALLAGLLTYARIVTAANPPLEWPEIVIIVIIAAASSVGVAFPLAVGLVEGLPMVLAKLYTDRIREEAREEGRAEGSQAGREEGRAEGRQEGRAEGRQEGAKLMLARWQEWNRRRQAAEQSGQPFNEPEPGMN